MPGEKDHDSQNEAADRALTARLKQAWALIDVRVLDHIIIAESEAVSFAERGML